MVVAGRSGGDSGWGIRFARAEGIVNTTDGRTLRGDIQQNPDGTTNVSFRGGTLTLDAGNVASIVYADDARADFDDRLKKLDPNDITGRIELGRMELSAGQYELATSAAEEAQRLDPHNPDAAILLDTIQAEQTLNVRMAVEAAYPTPVATKPSEGPCLTQADVYAIRRAELTPDDNVRLTFHNDVRSRYASLQSDAGGFDRETETQQAIDIIQSGDPNLAKDVHIESDPAVIREYRAEIQPKILEGCAAAGCHSGDAQGGFRLMTDASDTLPAYTNYFILQMSGEKLEGGSTFGHGPVFRPMIDPRGSMSRCSFSLACRRMSRSRRIPMRRVSGRCSAGRMIRSISLYFAGFPRYGRLRRIMAFNLSRRWAAARQRRDHRGNSKLETRNSK